MRCGRALCVEHIPIGRRRCDACELEYLERRDRVHAVRWALLGIGLVAIAWIVLWPVVPEGRVGGYRMITTGFPKLDFSLVCAVAAYFSARFVVALRRSISRWLFLGERGE